VLVKNDYHGSTETAVVSIHNDMMGVVDQGHRRLFYPQGRTEAMVRSRDVHGNGNTNMPKMGMGRVHVTMGMGMATFSCVPKFPLVDSMRMLANKIL